MYIWDGQYMSPNNTRYFKVSNDSRMPYCLIELRVYDFTSFYWFLTQPIRMTLVPTWQQLWIYWNGILCVRKWYTIVQHMPWGINIYVRLKFRFFQKTLTHPIGQYLSQSNGHRQMAPLLTHLFVSYFYKIVSYKWICSHGS